VLQDSGAELLNVPELLRESEWNAKAMADTTATPAPPAETAGKMPNIGKDPAADQLPETLPLSAFEFERHVQPKFPQRAADRRLSGWVDLRFLVNAEGKTENIEIMDSSPKGSFEKAATRAISGWRFKPMMADGVPVEKLSIVRLRFVAQ
jgi:protein TonB